MQTARMNNHKKMNIAQRAALSGVLLATLAAWQYATAPFNFTLLTGSGVNCLLAVCAIMCGAAYGVPLALISPVMAKLLGIGPMWELIPFVALGNTVYALLWCAVPNAAKRLKTVAAPLTVCVAAVAKFITLYFGIVVIAVPVVLRLPEKQAAIISAAFSVPQLFTALIGGAAALSAVTLLHKLSRGKQLK